MGHGEDTCEWKDGDGGDGENRESESADVFVIDESQRLRDFESDVTLG